MQKFTSMKCSDQTPLSKITIPSAKKLLFFILAFLSFHFSFAQADKNFHVRAFNEKLYTDQVSIFVKAEKSALQDYLKTHQGKYKYFSGGYHGVTIESKYVKDLLSQSFITGSDFNLHRPFLLNDTMRVRDNINPIHAGQSPLDTSYTGKGVLIGLIDSGLDFLHPDFRDANGNTRVVKVWDQTLAFDAQHTPAFYGYGQVWDSSEINNGTCPSIDGGNGHGTTVTGTATGNGLANGKHKGVAPEATIIIVRSNFNSANWLGTVADATDYIFKMADSLNMPCVINASLGDYFGSHDGTDPTALFIDSLIEAKPGRLFIGAAGNSGNIGNYHLRHDINSDTTFTWFKYNASSYLGYGAVFFEAYADTFDLQNAYYSVGANLPSAGGFQDRGRTSFVNILDHLGTVHSEQIINNGNVIANVDFYAEKQGGVYLLQVHLQEPDSNSYNFRFMTTGTGAIDIWSTSIFGTSNMVATSLPASSTLPEIVDYQMPDSSKIIVSSFSCGRKTLLVGNYYAMQTYIDYNGNTQNLGGTVGSISINSSRGPSRDMRVKPEVTASGDVHLSAGPLNMLTTLIATEPHKVAQGGFHFRNGGTSMACPVVTGIAALALQKCPSLTVDEFKDMITNSVKTDAFTGTVPNMSYGYGKVDGFAALLESNFTPVVPFTAICSADSVELMVNGNNYSYLWSTGDTTESIYANNIDTFAVSLRNEFGCKGSLDSIYTYFTTSTPATITIDIANENFVANSGLNYQWLFDGDTIVGATNQTYDYTIYGNGVYEVWVTDFQGCADTAFLIFNTLSLEESISDIQIFPNPTIGEIHISSEKNSFYNIVLRDATGKMLVYIPNMENPQDIISINMKNYARGIYLLEVSTENGKMVKKVVRD
jgi:subtilisin family serine protease